MIKPYWFMGIDVGAKGCICLMNKDMSDIRFYDYQPDNEQEYFKILGEVLAITPIAFATVEKLHAMPQQGVTSMFTFGCTYGKMLMFLMLKNIPYEQISPQKWQKALGVVIPKEAKGAHRKQLIKQKVKDKVTKLFPNAELYGKKGGYRDGRGDSLALAYYARMTYLQEQNNG